jgi:Flp pilus assembly protein CpaB
LKRSNRLVLLIGVFLAVVAFVAIVLGLGNNGGTGPNAVATPPTELPAVIAVKDIPLGATVTEDMLTTQNLKVDTERKPTAFSSTKLVVGSIARQPIANGTQLEAAYFDTSSTACGTIIVPPGLRAMSVQVDQVSGVGTVINSGDYVDGVVGFTGAAFPVVSLNPTDNSITVVSGLNGTSVKLLIEGMQVLCRQLPPAPAPASGQAPAPTASNGTSLNGQQEIVILAVTPTQAEIIKFSQLDGSISLVLRSSKDFVDEAGNPIPPIPAGTEGVTLKILTKNFAVPIPELVEAVLPAQASKKP